MNNIAGALYRVIKIKNEKRNEVKACLKLLYSSTQTSADDLNGRRHVSRITDEKGETWSLFGM